MQLVQKLVNATTERCGRLVNTRASYSEGPEFKYHPRDRPWRQDLRGFPQPLQEIAGIVP
jgi:hypothetical protein